MSGYVGRFGEICISPLPLYFPSVFVAWQLGLELGTDNLIYTSFYFKDKIASRQADMAEKKQLTLRASALSDQPVKAWVILQLNNGLEYGTTVLLSKNQL